MDYSTEIAYTTDYGGYPTTALFLNLREIELNWLKDANLVARWGRTVPLRACHDQQ